MGGKEERKAELAELKELTELTHAATILCHAWLKNKPGNDRLRLILKTFKFLYQLNYFKAFHSKKNQQQETTSSHCDTVLEVSSKKHCKIEKV